MIEIDKVPKELRGIEPFLQELYLCCINQGYIKGEFTI